MQKERFEFAQLISRYLLNKLRPDEEKSLMKAVKEDENKRQILEYYRDSVPAQERLDYINSLDLDTAWQKINERHGNQIKSRSKLKILKYAAVFALLISSFSLWLMISKKDSKIIPDLTNNYHNDVLPGGNVAELILSDGKKISLDSGKVAFLEKNGTNLLANAGELIYNNSKPTAEADEILYNTLLVPRAGTYSLQLPDGTKVWLNAMSELKFPVTFHGKDRKVELKGEGYFEVKKDVSRPFKVSLNGSEIEVLGTSFNVSSYEKTSITTLVEGSVKINFADQKAFLKPGEQAVVNSSILISKGDVEKATAWRNGYFYFDNDGIVPILEQIGKWYDLKIIYKTKAPKLNIGGSISRKVKLTEVLQMIKDVSNISFEIEGRNLIVN
ncbi:FecR family protein [Pedobacter nyackensis]|uniref:FecR family protein n=1 Tax=Pedobacter nyackensis TaxID=475255 RepID=UPI00292EB3E9|nr:FecR domain-containing protein [Pedobacter nyackensis]